MAGLGNAHLIPRRQTLDVRREDVARAEPARPYAVTARANNFLALAEPEPLTLAEPDEKSFMRLIGLETAMAVPAWVTVDEIFLHVPRPGGTSARRAPGAMQADVARPFTMSAGLEIVVPM